MGIWLCWTDCRTAILSQGRRELRPNVSHDIVNYQVRVTQNPFALFPLTPGRSPEGVVGRAVGGQHRGRRLRVDALQGDVRGGDGGADLLVVGVSRRLRTPTHVLNHQRKRHTDRYNQQNTSLQPAARLRGCG